MMKSSKSRTHGRADQVADRVPERTGSWRCRPCAGDYVSPSPKAPRKGKKTQKQDFLNDPLFTKPSQPIPAREDNRLAIAWRQEGHAKENEDSDSHRGKIDGQLRPASQQDQGQRKLTDGKVGSGEEKDAFQSPRFSLHLPRHSKAESIDLFELAPNPTVSDEVAGDGVKGLVSTQSFHNGEAGTDSNTGHAESDPLEGGKDSQHKDLIKSGSSGDEDEHSATLNSDQDTGRKEGSATLKTGLNINIPPSERYSLEEDEGEKLKVLEETESPVSVLQGIPELEIPQAEGGEGQAWKDNNSTQSGQGIAELKLQRNGPLRPDSSKDTGPASNHTHSCAGSQLVAEKLECPFDNVQTGSSEFFEIAKSGKALGTPQAEFDSLQQGAPTPESSGFREAGKESQSSGVREDGKEMVTPKTEGESPHNADEKVEAAGEAGPDFSLIGGKDHDSQHMENFNQGGPADHERDTLNRDSLLVFEGGEKTKDGLHEKTLDGGLEDLEHDESFLKSESLEGAKAGSLHRMGAASIHGTGEDRSSQLQTDHPDKTGEAAAHLPPTLHHQESFRLGFFTVPRVLVVGAITAISLLGKAASS